MELNGRQIDHYSPMKDLIDCYYVSKSDQEKEKIQEIIQVKLGNIDQKIQIIFKNLIVFATDKNINEIDKNEWNLICTNSDKKKEIQMLYSDTLKVYECSTTLTFFSDKKKIFPPIYLLDIGLTLQQFLNIEKHEYINQLTNLNFGKLQIKFSWIERNIEKNETNSLCFSWVKNLFLEVETIKQDFSWKQAKKLIKREWKSELLQLKELVFSHVTMEDQDFFSFILQKIDSIEELGQKIGLPSILILKEKIENKNIQMNEIDQIILESEK